MIKFLTSLLKKINNTVLVSTDIKEIDVFSAEQVEIWNLQKAATQKKNQQDFYSAVQLLEAAIDIAARHDIPLDAKDYIRYANYLQLAKLNDKAWGIFNKILGEYLTIFHQIEIYNAMRIFLQREGRNKLAVQYGVLVRLLEIKKWKDINTQDIKNNIDLQYIFKNNPDFQSNIIDAFDIDISKIAEENKKRWETISTKKATETFLKPLLKKANLLTAQNEITEEVIKLIIKTPIVDIVEVFNVIPTILNKYDTQQK